jgi:transposase InsO family protein
MAALWGVTRRRLYQLLQLSREMGGVPHLKFNRRPKSPPLTEEQKAILRQEWARSPRGSTLIYRALKHRGIVIPKMKIHAFARSQGWTLANPRKQKQRKWVRYEREHSGSLLHGDFHCTSEKHPHCILWEDDASRKILAGGEFPEETGEGAIATLKEALAQARVWNLTVREVLTDRGCQFWVSEIRDRRHGETEFQAFVREKGIKHILARVNHPQTNGKLERLWREYDRHRWRYATLQEFIDWYNGEIHGALWDMECPNEAFQRKLPPETLLGLHERLVAKITIEASA